MDHSNRFYLSLYQVLPVISKRKGKENKTKKSACLSKLIFYLLVEEYKIYSAAFSSVAGVSATGASATTASPEDFLRERLVLVVFFAVAAVFSMFSL